MRASVAKLPEEVVRLIRSMEPIDFEQLAEKYGTTVKYMKGLRSPRRSLCVWKDIPVKGYEDPNSIPSRMGKKLKAEDAIAIYRDKINLKRVIAAKYGITVRMVYDIRSGKRWRNVTSKI